LRLASNIGIEELVESGSTPVALSVVPCKNSMNHRHAIPFRLVTSLGFILVLLILLAGCGSTNTKPARHPRGHRRFRWVSRPPSVATCRFFKRVSKRSGFQHGQPQEPGRWANRDDCVQGRSGCQAGRFIDCHRSTSLPGSVEQAQAALARDQAS